MKKLFPLILLVLLCSGCASIISGNQTQTTIKTDVPAKLMVIDNWTGNVVRVGSSPLKLKLKTYNQITGDYHTSAASYSVVVQDEKSPEYAQFFTIQADINPHVWGNAVFLFPFGFFAMGIDEQSGAAFRFEDEYYFEVSDKSNQLPCEDLIKKLVKVKNNRSRKALDEAVSEQNHRHTTIINEIRPHAYGPGIHSDEYGRPVKYQVQGEPNADTTLLQVKPNAYGHGVGMDQYGRLVKLVPAY